MAGDLVARCQDVRARALAAGDRSLVAEIDAYFRRLGIGPEAAVNPPEERAVPARPARMNKR